MTDEQIKQEFNRWIDAGRPKVWVKEDTDNDWFIANIPLWAKNFHYIVNDKQAKLRKLQIDAPDTKFEYYNELDDIWYENGIQPFWNINTEYRVKPKEWYEDPNIKDKPIWVKSCQEDKWHIDTFIEYVKGYNNPFICNYQNWKYAKPVSCGDLYNGEIR